VWRRRHAAIKRGVAVYQFTSEQVAAKVAFWGALCWVCRAPYEAIDHVKPLAKGGPHMLANLRPICTACNSRKRDRWPLP
jgi:5-methylcytosine-specific restriction endonuclease McrA